MKYQDLLFSLKIKKKEQKLSSAPVVIGALRVYREFTLRWIGAPEMFCFHFAKGDIFCWPKVDSLVVEIVQKKKKKKKKKK